MNCVFIQGAKRGPKGKVHKHLRPKVVRITNNYKKIEGVSSQHTQPNAQQNVHQNLHQNSPDINHYTLGLDNVNHHIPQPNLINNQRIWVDHYEMFCQQILEGDNLNYCRKQDNLLMQDACYSFESPTSDAFQLGLIGQ
ncbi:2883_t:CDS:1 [Scutellospora calospora]|uniref:2883_t:CDS:1 n=1 Tax=Scutellospora calospora TaxID=85575 RepID=A0ACA9LZZ9_9GLOM|nr:2883_t:CDS:1 [Scutellospora calospora]